MKVVFLDRDGTINRLFDKKYIDNPQNVELLPFVKEGLTEIRKDYKLVLVTNQTGIGAGYYTYEDFLAVNNEIQKQLGFNFDAIYACYHHPEKYCTCRKPNIGMFLQAQNDLGPIDWKQSWMIGDSCKDMQAGKKMGLKTILIGNNCEADYQVNGWKEILAIFTHKKTKMQGIKDSKGEKNFLLENTLHYVSFQNNITATSSLLKQVLTYDIDKLYEMNELIQHFNLDNNIKNIKKFSRLLGTRTLKNNIFGEIILKKFQQNIEEIKSFLNEIVMSEDYKENKFDNFLIGSLLKVGKVGEDTVKKVYNDILKDFLSKNVNIKFQKLINFDDLDFLKNDFYNFKNLSDEETIIRSIYIISITYYLSYVFWLKKIYNQYKEITKNSNISAKEEKLINKYLDKLGVSKSSVDYYIMYTHAYLFIQTFSPEEAEFLIEHIKRGRFKTIDSAIFKLLKREKYIEAYEKEGILPDQYGLLITFDNIFDLKRAAKSLKDRYEKFLSTQEKERNTIYINKYNDRGVIDYTSDNRETSEKMLPFVNGGFIINDLPLGEISCRLNYKIRLNEILKEYQTTKNKAKLVKRLLSEIDEFDHDIYKVSQIIKVLRKLFVDKKILPVKKNLKKSAQHFIEKKTKYLINNIRKKLKENNINIEFTDEDLKTPIYDRLRKQIHQAIIDIAWEETKHTVKRLKSYSNLSGKEKRDFLKRISKKLITATIKNQKQIKGFETEGNKLLKIFKKYYKNAKDISIFYDVLKK